MKEKVLKLFKQYEGYTDRSMTHTAIGSDNFEDLAEEIVKLFAIPDVSNRRELLIAVLKTVKGITIPETDEQIEKFVEQYSN